MQLIGKAQCSLRFIAPPAILFRKYKSVKSGEKVAGGGSFFSMVKYTQERAMQRTTE